MLTLMLFVMFHWDVSYIYEVDVVTSLIICYPISFVTCLLIVVISHKAPFYLDI
jgi:hypothetical protein